MKKVKRLKKTKKATSIQKRLLVLAILGCAMLMAIWLNQYTQDLRSKANTAACVVSDKLVNSCRPWLGAYANRYPGHTDTGMQDQLTDHENRIGRKVDFLHYYHPVGSLPLNADEKSLINRTDTYLLINWKPAAKWADAAGNNATINANIDTVAESIKSVAPKKIILIVHHEPENDISSGVSCATLKGSSGSPKDYTDMWHNVRKRFDDKGVTNVVWSFTITGYKGWFCTLDALYPGDQYVDWIMFDIYGGGNDDPFDESAQIIYDYLTQNSNSSHNYLSKPWGIAETSNFNTDKEQAAKYWDDAKAAVESNKYPNIKLYTVFDSKNDDGDFRIGYDKGGALDANELEHYKAFANSPKFLGTTQPAPSGTTTQPNPSSPTGLPGTTPTTDNPTPSVAPTVNVTQPPDPVITSAVPTNVCLGSCPTAIPTQTGITDPNITIMPGVPGGTTGPCPLNGGGGLIGLILQFIMQLLQMILGLPVSCSPSTPTPPVSPAPTSTIGIPTDTLVPTVDVTLVPTIVTTP